MEKRGALRKGARKGRGLRYCRDLKGRNDTRASWFAETSLAHRELRATGRTGRSWKGNSPSFAGGVTPSLQCPLRPCFPDALFTRLGARGICQWMNSRVLGMATWTQYGGPGQPFARVAS